MGLMRRERCELASYVSRQREERDDAAISWRTFNCHREERRDVAIPWCTQNQRTFRDCFVRAFLAMTASVSSRLRTPGRSDTDAAAPHRLIRRQSRPAATAPLHGHPRRTHATFHTPHTAPLLKQSARVLRIQTSRPENSATCSVHRAAGKHNPDSRGSCRHRAASPPRTWAPRNRMYGLAAPRRWRHRSRQAFGSD
jgi:hypothetical protein